MPLSASITLNDLVLVLDGMRSSPRGGSDLTTPEYVDAGLDFVSVSSCLV